MKQSKLHFALPATAEPYHDAPSLKFRISHPDGSGYLVDLTEFAEGGKAENVPTKVRAGWGGDFAGRPVLARELADLFEALRPKHESAVQIRYGMRAFFRFLDQSRLAGGPDVAGVVDVTDAHGPMFLQWLDGELKGAYRRTKTALDRMRQLAGLQHPLFWPARQGDMPAPAEDVDEQGVRRLFHALRHEARAVKGMFSEGERLAAAGRDPRNKGRRERGWFATENRAWLMKNLTRERLLNRQEFIDQNAFWGMMGGGAQAVGPFYLAPGMTERGRVGIVGGLRWFHPSYQDTAVFLWIFLIGTGWNLSTALALDVSHEESWYQPHPHSEGFAVMHAFKNRADRHQFALSMTRPEWHPYKIVRYMIERTKVLRATVRHELAKAQERYQLDPTPENDAAVAKLDARARSPWLYHVINKTGEVSAFNNNDSTHLNSLVRTVVEKHGLAEDHPSLMSMSTSAARDAWIGHAYVQSGYHVLLTRLASQHATARTLKHYLRSKRYRARSEHEVRKVQDAVFAEISSGRVVDPTRLRLLVRNGTITQDQERRLLDLRQRTRLGMGCIDPTDPPPEIAPDHKADTLCRVQRCTGCQHGVVFAESLVPLARASAELVFIQRTIPYAAWAGSSLEAELKSIELTLQSFDPAAVQAEVESWSDKIRKGEVVPHDTYPSY